MTSEWHVQALNQTAGKSSKKTGLTPRGRFCLCYCVAILLLGPFGFVLGPLASVFWQRRVERKDPFAAGQAKARDTGYNFGQLVAMTIATLWGIGGALFVWTLIKMVAVPLFYGQPA